MSSYLIQVPNVFCHIATFLDIHSHIKLAGICKTAKTLCSEHRSMCRKIVIQQALPPKIIKTYFSSRVQSLELLMTGSWLDTKGFLRAWHKDVMELFFKHLHQCTNLEKLSLACRREHLHKVAKLKTLRHLKIEILGKPIDLEYEVFDQLETELCELEELNIKFENLDPCEAPLGFIGSLKKLHTLCIQGAFFTEGHATTLISLPSLTKLSILGDIYPSYYKVPLISRMKLQVLIITMGPTYITNSPCSSLRELYIETLPGFDGDSLRKLLKNLPNLTVLHIKGGVIKECDLELLIGTQITDFSLTENGVDGSFLKKIYFKDSATPYILKTQIKKLTLDCHKFTDYCGVKKLTDAGIEFIDLSHIC